jgi:hypothetical protein
MGEEKHKFNDKIPITYTRYFHSIASYSVGIIRALEEAFGKENVHKVIKEWAEYTFREKQKRKMETTNNPIASFEDFKNQWKSAANTDYWTHVVTVSFPEDSDQKLECRYTECLWAKTMKGLDAEDIGYLVCCHPDFAIAEVTHPKLRLERTKTLMQGDDYCNHTFLWRD